MFIKSFYKRGAPNHKGNDVNTVNTRTEELLQAKSLPNGRGSWVVGRGSWVVGVGKSRGCG